MLPLLPPSISLLFSVATIGILLPSAGVTAWDSNAAALSRGSTANYRIGGESTYSSLQDIRIRDAFDGSRPSALSPDIDSITTYPVRDSGPTLGDIPAPSSPPSKPSIPRRGNSDTHRIVEPIIQDLVEDTLGTPHSSNNEVTASILSQQDECNQAIKKYKRLDREIDDGSGTLAFRQLEAGKRYDSACLKQVPANDTREFEKRAYEIVGIVGAIGDQQNKGIRDTWCVATYIGLNQILIAKHCIFGDSPAYADRLDLLKSGSVKFQRMSSPEEIYTVNTLKPLSYADVRNEVKFFEDALILTLDRPITSAQLPNFDGDAESGDRLLVMGFFQGEGIASESAAASWVAHMRKGRFENCIVETRKGSCVTHTCTTTPRFSGSPMIRVPRARKAESKIEIIGLHVEAANDAYCYSQAGVLGHLNAGLVASRIRKIITSTRSLSSVTRDIGENHYGEH